MYTYLIIKNNEYALWIILRASTLVVLNSYIAIFSTTKYQNVPYNGGAKAIFFGSTTTMHSYCILCVRSHCYYYFILIFYLFLYIVFLFVRSQCYCSKYIILL